MERPIKARDVHRIKRVRLPGALVGNPALLQHQPPCGRCRDVSQERGVGGVWNP